MGQNYGKTSKRKPKIKHKSVIEYGKLQNINGNILTLSMEKAKKTQEANK